MRRALIFLYGSISYVMFLGVFVYLCLWMSNLFVPNTIDGAPRAPFLQALLTNLGLLALFGVQHSVMARPTFKKWWTTIIPVEAERSTYVLLTNFILILFFWQWQPMGGTIWNIQDPVMQMVVYGIYAFGWLLVLVSTFLINHFDLFGLRQVWMYLQGKKYTNLGFVTPGPYKMIRHPLYLGWLLVFWAAPVMTVAHLVFSIATTGYIFIAIQLEEKDLGSIHGRDYAEYKKKVPMILPFGKKKKLEGAYDQAT